MSDNDRIRVVIADDQELVRVGFAMVIGSQKDMQVVGQASDGAQAVAAAESLHPDVVLMDVRMPGMDGIEATQRITAGQNGVRPTRVIILTTFDLDEYVMAAINAGASGFLLKDTRPATLLSSIRTVFDGNAIIAPTATKRLIEKMMEDGYARNGSATAAGTGAGAGAGAGASAGVFAGAAGAHPLAGAARVGGISAGGGAADGADGAGGGMIGGSTTVGGHAVDAGCYTDPELDLLTDREREVLIEIAHGLSNQEIAAKLFISLPTVKTHVAHILAKINARDRVQAVVFAYDNHLV